MQTDNWKSDLWQVKWRRTTANTTSDSSLTLILRYTLTQRKPSQRCMSCKLRPPYTTFRDQPFRPSSIFFRRIHAKTTWIGFPRTPSKWTNNLYLDWSEYIKLDLKWKCRMTRPCLLCFIKLRHSALQIFKQVAESARSGSHIHESKLDVFFFNKSVLDRHES